MFNLFTIKTKLVHGCQLYSVIFHSSLPCIHTYSFDNVRSHDATPIRYEISFVSAMLLKLHLYICTLYFVSWISKYLQWMGFRCPCLNGHEFQIDSKINDTLRWDTDDETNPDGLFYRCLPMYLLLLNSFLKYYKQKMQDQFPQK